MTMEPVVARRVLSADRRGSSWPVLAETHDGLRFTKLRGAAQGTGPLVAEIIVATIAESLGLRVPRRSLVRFGAKIESADRDGELRELLDASKGTNLGFEYLDGGRVLAASDVGRISHDDAAAIVWLDRFVMNPDRTDRNPNLMWWRNQLWLIDHGASLGFQYTWSAVTEASTGAPLIAYEPHVLRDRVPDLPEWDTLFAERITRDLIERAVANVPDDFIEPLLPHPSGESLRRRRAAYGAFLWKRLKFPRGWVTSATLPERPQRRVPAWLLETARQR